jgi:LAO/AO transport system kinase
MEIADLFVVNKADRPGAEKLRQEIEVTLGIRRGNAFRNVPAHHGFDGRPVKAGARAARGGRGAAAAGTPSGPSEWAPPVVLIVAAKGDGVAELIAALDRHHAWLEESGALTERRRRRLLDRTREVVDRAARRWVWEETRANERIEQRLDDIASRAASPYEVAAEVLESLKQGDRP